MNILLTGANGQLAKKFLEIETNATVWAFSHCELDITDASQVQLQCNQLKPDIVINCAAYTNVEQAEFSPEIAHEVNGLGVKYLAIACNELAIPLIHISTDYVFDGHKDHSCESHWLNEKDKTHPLNEYGKSKLAGEKFIIEYCQKYVILRTSWLFSEHGNNFVKSMISLAKQKKELSVVSDQWGHPTYAGDLANAIYSLAQQIVIQKKFQSWGTYHFAGIPSTSWNKFAQMIFQKALDIDLLGTIPVVKGISSEEYLCKAQRPKNNQMSFKKIAPLLGEMPQWNIGLCKTLIQLQKDNVR